MISNFIYFLVTKNTANFKQGMMSQDLVGISGLRTLTIHEDILIRLTHNKDIGRPEAKMYTTIKKLRNEIYTINIYRTVQ